MPNIKVTRAEFESYWVNRRRRKRRLDTLQNLLFGHGEDGFLFGNFGELDELFTTTTGQTNVAANDDPVGLALDDHSWGSQTLAQIVAAQSELVTNGSFSADANWFKGTGWTISSGAAVKAAGTGSVLGQELAGVDGAAYFWTMTITRAAGSVNIGWVGTGTVFGYSITASGTYSGIMVAPASGGLTTLRVTAAADIPSCLAARLKLARSTTRVKTRIACSWFMLEQ